MLSNYKTIVDQINVTATNLIHLSIDIPNEPALQKAKSDLADAAATMAAMYNSSRQQTTALNVTVKLNQASDYAEKCKFWLEFINKEFPQFSSLVQENLSELNQVKEFFYIEKIRKEKDIPMFAGEWLLDF
jgi:hypothetical protein